MEQLFRKVEFNEEVILLLNNYVQNKWPLIIWQTDARHAAREAIITDINIPQKQISVVVSDHQHKLDLKKVIFCKGDEKKLVFKSFHQGENGSQLTLQIPDDIRLHESRLDPRFDLFTNKKAFMTVSMMSHYESKESSFVLKMIDVSTKGCSLVMHSTNLKHFREGEKVKVTQIGSDIVNIPFEATITHIFPIKSKGTGSIQLYKLGLSFSKKIVFYNYFLTRHLEW